MASCMVLDLQWWGCKTLPWCDCVCGTIGLFQSQCFTQAKMSFYLNYYGVMEGFFLALKEIILARRSFFILFLQ
jgi:hypothetical protein